MKTIVKFLFLTALSVSGAGMVYFGFVAYGDTTGEFAACLFAFLTAIIRWHNDRFDEEAEEVRRDQAGSEGR